MKKPSRAQSPLVSIVIPVYNKCELTVGCLDSLAKVGARVAHEILVVDDGSSDGTAQLLAERRDQVRAFRNPTNLGFAGSCNRGAAEARGKHILFLNNDTVALPGWLDVLVDELHRHPAVVAVGSRLLYADGLVQHAGVLFERDTRNPYHPNRLLHASDPRVNRRRELQAITAACILIRANWFKDCGCFSTNYQTGYEDLDLCLTIRKRGGTIMYEPKSAVVHLESQTPGRMRHEDDNRRHFFEKWSEQLLSDEDAYFFEDGLRLLRHRNEYGQGIRAVRFTCDEERDRWAIVAECQRAAAAHQHEQMLRCFAKCDAWPEDAAIRRWAGVHCRRLGLHSAAKTHLLAAALLAPEPALRAHLSLSDPQLQLPTADPVAAWETDLIEGFRKLQERDFAVARQRLELALDRGAPPAWALRGLWKAAAGLGDTATERAMRHALITMPRTDPATARELAAGTAG
jgi:O-antigen biosynthesis protein